jgi:hypothetical protein
MTVPKSVIDFKPRALRRRARLYEISAQKRLEVSVATAELPGVFEALQHFGR